MLGDGKDKEGHKCQPTEELDSRKDISQLGKLVKTAFPEKLDEAMLEATTPCQRLLGYA